MAQVVNVNFRMDADLKQSMEKVCSELGMTMTTAFTIFAKKVSRENRIPFDVSVDPFYSENNLRHLEQIARDVAEDTPASQSMNCPRWNNAAVMGGESLGRLSLLAGARQESAETHQHADSRKA
ncbi:MAG: type II toxin-antitoxin system RelB/DinJ family antitoxin [Oscillospiraceae bacterium]|nr:type II toxin-antitoxin system RelB/DinJ family antitoxin [Oscillospiraceae bacterium]